MRISKPTLFLPALLLLQGLAFSSVVWGQTETMTDPASFMPRSARYIALGFNGNTVNFGNQDVIAIGTSDVIDAGVIIASGEAEGPDDASGGTPIRMDTQFTFSPSLQLGYFQHFEGSVNRLWGVKFSNDYLGAVSEYRLPRFPQVGQFTYIADPLNPVPFTGNAIATSINVQLVDQLAFRPYLGHSYGNGFVYVGGGPTLSHMRTEVTDLVGFADINGTRSNISGAPQDFSDADWVWGGSAEVGVTHFLSSSWFLECSYVLGVTADHTFNFSGTFSNTDPSDPTQIKEGTLVGSSQWQAITQSFGLRLCKTF